MLTLVETDSNTATLDVAIDTLLLQLKKDHPQAGPAYWANRCWALIYWQPVYLAVYSVHKHNGWMSFKKFQLALGNQSTSDDFILANSGFNKAADTTKIPFLLKRQALELMPLLEIYLDRLKKHIPINSINAWRLIADCILLVLLEISTINKQNTLDYSRRWLMAFGLFDRNGKPHSQLKEDFNPEHSGLALDRKSCCMHYLIEPNNPCNTCIKYSCTIRTRKRT